MLIRQTALNGVVFYTSLLLTRRGIPHGFSTRIGGVSTPPFDSLNLGNPAGDIRDDSANVAENLTRFESAVELADRRRLWVHQVHGCGVATASDPAFENGTQADAIICCKPSEYALIRIADCVPILLAAGPCVAAVHAGWRGVVAGVVGEAVRKLIHAAQVPVNDVVAAIGPCIGKSAFEVGPEVIEQFVSLFGKSSDWSDRRVDLRVAVERQLRSAGVSEIDTTDRCTSTHRDEFFSHRRDRGITGRMAAVIGARNS